jgi:glycosyltransferase involved in cell wall biosynthesis
MKDLSVAQVGPYPPPYGGISVHIKRMHLRLSAHGIPSWVYCQPARGAAREPHLLRSGLAFRWYTWIPEFGWRCPASIVHVHDGWFWAPAARFMLARGHGVVMTIHDQLAGTVGWRRASALERAAARTLLGHPRVRWVAVSDEVRRQLLEKGAAPERILVAPAYLPPPPDADASGLPGYVREFLAAHAPVLSTYAWRLTLDHDGVDMYGFDQCIEMLARMKAEHPRIGLVISLPEVGNAEYFRELNTRLAAAGIGDHVLFVTEPLDDVHRLWAASDVFVRATNTDGDAVAVREALSRRVPVVASDASQRPEGTIVFPTRNLEAMTAAVRDALARHADHVRALERVTMADNFPPILELYRELARA